MSLLVKDNNFFDGNPRLFDSVTKLHHENIYSKITFSAIANYANHGKGHHCNAYLMNYDVGNMFTNFPGHSTCYNYFPSYPNIPVWLITSRTIAKNEEICFDYGWSNEMKRRFNIVD